jgi:hypothetical protein
MGKKLKTEHAGAKNGGGFWGRREEAKTRSRSARRQQDKAIVRVINSDEWCLAMELEGQCPYVRVSKDSKDFCRKSNGHKGRHKFTTSPGEVLIA